MLVYIRIQVPRHPLFCHYSKVLVFFLLAETAFVQEVLVVQWSAHNWLGEAVLVYLYFLIVFSFFFFYYCALEGIYCHFQSTFYRQIIIIIIFSFLQLRLRKTGVNVLGMIVLWST